MIIIFNSTTKFHSSFPPQIPPERDFRQAEHLGGADARQGAALGGGEDGRRADQRRRRSPPPVGGGQSREQETHRQVTAVGKFRTRCLILLLYSNNMRITNDPNNNDNSKSCTERDELQRVEHLKPPAPSPP